MKIPRSKPGWPLIYCRSEIFSVWDLCVLHGFNAQVIQMLIFRLKLNANCNWLSQTLSSPQVHNQFDWRRQQILAEIHPVLLLQYIHFLYLFNEKAMSHFVILGVFVSSKIGKLSQWSFNHCARCHGSTTLIWYYPLIITPTIPFGYKPHSFQPKGNFDTELLDRQNNWSVFSV